MDIGNCEYHGGSTSGFQSSLVHYPEDEPTIAVLMNSGQGDPEQLEEALARAAFGMELRTYLLRQRK